MARKTIKAKDLCVGDWLDHSSVRGMSITKVTKGGPLGLLIHFKQRDPISVRADQRIDVIRR